MDVLDIYSFKKSHPELILQPVFKVMEKPWIHGFVVSRIHKFVGLLLNHDFNQRIGNLLSGNLFSGKVG